MTAKTLRKEHAAHPHRAKPIHPHSVATLTPEDVDGQGNAAFIEPEVRYRMISEAAYHRFLERGCEDGFDVDDWLTAENDVDRQLLDRGSVEAMSGA